jgi:hypothetical protein
MQVHQPRQAHHWFRLVSFSYTALCEFLLLVLCSAVAALQTRPTLMPLQA